jgi:hypothetical protein
MGFVMRDLTRRWPAARIPFEIDPALTADQQQIAKDAVFFWNNSAGVLLTPHAGEPDFVVYTPDPPGNFGGHSSIGRVGGMQAILMDYGWSEAVGALLHETGHAAGLIHEHQRPDRDTYVVAPPNATTPDLAIDLTNVPIGPYDCRSVMHYYTSATDPTAFRTKAPGCWYPYHGILLSPGDVRALQALYWGGAWVDRGMAARDIGAGADGSAWVIGTTPQGPGFSVSRWDGSTWHALPGAGLRISTSSLQTAWLVDGHHAIFEWIEPHGWTPRPGAAVDIAMGADGSVWMVTANPAPGDLGVRRWDGNAWVPTPPFVPLPPFFPPAFSAPAARIAARSHNEAWVVTARGEILQWTGAWTHHPGVGHDIGIGADGTVGKTDPLGEVSFWSPERSEWVVIDSPPLAPGPSRSIEMAVGPNGLPWVANANVVMFERTLGPGL